MTKQTNWEQIDTNVELFQPTEQPTEFQPPITLDRYNQPNQSHATDVPHHAYTQAMARRAHRYALMTAAQHVGEIDWKYTKQDWTVLKAGDDGETMFVSVRMAIPKTEYERRVRDYERMQKMRNAKAAKREAKDDT
jgi:hypothetical protein